MAIFRRSRKRKVSIERRPSSIIDGGIVEKEKEIGDVSISIYLDKDDPRVIAFEKMQHFEIREVPNVGFVLIGKY